MSRHLRTGTLLALLAGLALAVLLFAQSDMTEVLAAVAAAGWGVVWIALYRFLPLALDAIGWRILVEPHERPSAAAFLRIRWVGEAVNTLLPVAQVGGDVVRARLLALSGADGARAGASVAADFTVGLAGQLVFTLSGLAVLAALVGETGATGSVIAGTAVAALLVGAFYLAQRRGLFGLLGRVAGRLPMGGLGERIEGGAGRLNEAVVALYRQHRRMALCSLWRLVAWFIRAGETWLALHFIGVPVGLAEAIVIESLSNAARSAAFAVPGAVGAQEGGVLGAGLLVGLSPETALALALVKRIREVLVGAPGLIAWTLAEGGRGR